MTMKLIGASRDAWKYLMKSVNLETGAERISGKAAYYMACGTPPGVWAGAGLAALGLAGMDAVEEDQLRNLFGEGSHPLTGETLGKSFVIAATLDERIKARLEVESFQEASLEEQAELEARITGEELDKPVKQSVAGFECVFSPPKSVSSWWAMADPDMKDAIRQAHHAAINATINKLETEIIRTRTGSAGVAQEHIHGISAALFDHWDSRDGDPQLHTHMLISNRVQGLDNKWRTIDSRWSLSPAVATVGAFYDSVLMDELSARFGITWTTDEVINNPSQYAAWCEANQLTDSSATAYQFSLETGNVKSGNVHWQISGVPAKLNTEFSSRAGQIKRRTETIIANYTRKYGHAPDAAALIKIRQAATIRTRAHKNIRSLKDLTTNWRNRATPIVGDTFNFADRIHNTGLKLLETYNLWLFRHDDITQHNTNDVVTLVLKQLGTTRSTFSRTNAEAFVLRATTHWRFRSAEDRNQTTACIVGDVLTAAVKLTPASTRHTPAKFRTHTGEDMFAPRSRQLYTTTEVWDAEERLLIAGEDRNSVKVSEEVIATLLHAPTTSENRTLSSDQAEAVRNIITSGRHVDVLVGPAGAGKTTSLEKLRELWEAEHGYGSVRGLAPTAKAADVLATTLGIRTENTAKWLYETSRNTIDKHGFSYQLASGDLLIVDEASIAGTLALDALREQTQAAGAKLLLVGDWAQLSAVDAGGAFGLLATSRPDVAELTSLHRFSNDWEKDASIALRLGKTDAIDTYHEHGRIHSGLSETILEEIIQAWKSDESQLAPDGTVQTSLLIASNNDMVDALNQKARKWRIEQGVVDASTEAVISTGVASIGDRIVTRENNRYLRTNFDRWVKNNDEFTITAITADGDIHAANGAEHVILPAEYAKSSIQLAYATTAHRAQGRTVTTAHALIDSSTTRETLYVGMTRGKHSNTAYIIIDEDDTYGDKSSTSMRKTWREILETVITTQGSNKAAHAITALEEHRLGNIGQLVAEYHTLIGAVLEEYYAPLLTELGLLNPTHESPYLGPVLANLRRLENTGANIPETITTLLNSRSTHDARDVLAVLHYRLAKHFENIPETHNQTNIAGLIEPPPHLDDPDITHAIDDRTRAIQLRAEQLLDTAIETGEPWLEELGPILPGEEEAWRRRAITVTCYRDLYNITSNTALGKNITTSTTKQRHHDIAAQALIHAPTHNVEDLQHAATENPHPNIGITHTLRQ
ncbi:MobF family relaxase [Aurantimicrobium minutum]|uniref:MobF family relaxase n=1 Tax=Aurantimicrobium minutum TaxID=708131 RepID=UPI0024769528|nr:MobF family relaxase [Aurantimicrobium minutum]